MKIPVIDGSNYFKGMLLLVRKDNKISEPEHVIITRIGKALGFEKNFIEDAINEIIGNKFISEEPPVFSTHELAEKFIKDGLILAASDKQIHPREEEWLLAVAAANKIEPAWYFGEKKSLMEMKHHTIRLDADDLDVRY
jgi:hypothetical protein